MCEKIVQLREKVVPYQIKVNAAFCATDHKKFYSFLLPFGQEVIYTKG